VTVTVKTPAFLAPLLRKDAGACRLHDHRGQVLASRLYGAFDSASRRRGLLGRERFDEGEAIVIAPCNAVHTFFMRFPIDVVYLDRKGRVVKVKPNLRPGRVNGSWRGFAVVELAAGTAARLGLREGDVLTAS
jgi:uncharacterized protein